MIEISHISKSFNGKRVLDNISLKVEKDCILALIGPSGCGKSTLLRLIAGLEAPDEGAIMIDSVQVSSSNRVVAPGKRHLAMIFQDLALWPHMTAYQHLRYALSQRENTTRRAADQKIHALLDAVNLADCFDRYPHQLSGGEQQRLAIVRALAQEPEYLLMDEPFSSLDTVLKEELELFVGKIRRQSGLGIVYVTHDMRDLKRIADQVAVLRNGRLLQIGEKRHVFSNPADSYVKKHLQAAFDG